MVQLTIQCDIILSEGDLGVVFYTASQNKFVKIYTIAIILHLGAI